MYANHYGDDYHRGSSYFGTSVFITVLLKMLDCCFCFIKDRQHFLSQFLAMLGIRLGIDI
jgi:hypothetical protein